MMLEDVNMYNETEDSGFILEFSAILLLPCSLLIFFPAPLDSSLILC